MARSDRARAAGSAARSRAITIEILVAFCSSVMNCVAVLPLARSSAARTFSGATKGAAGVAATGVRVVFGCLEAAGAPPAVRRREIRQLRPQRPIHRHEPQRVRSGDSSFRMGATEDDRFSVANAIFIISDHLIDHLSLYQSVSLSLIISATQCLRHYIGFVRGPPNRRTRDARG
eukprot:COSAG06_NODE_26744_length_608_cov_0.740668_1_plen_175_part_00